jgi:hypothetical protein
MNWDVVKAKFLEEAFYGNNKELTSLSKDQIKAVLSFFNTNVYVQCNSVTWKMEGEEKKIIQNFINKFFNM